MRFGFGSNWQAYAKHVDVAAIAEAERSQVEMLGRDSLRGKRFLDIGSGSGLFSLAAVRLGAERVHSFDYDSDSVACTRSIKDRFAPDAGAWTIERGDVLDDGYMRALGSWDVVYSWGVLHHTGDLWRALANVTKLVRPNGRLYIALYNDQGVVSRFWLAVKRLYVGSGRWIQKLMEIVFFAGFAGILFALDLVRLRNPRQRHDGTARRGMTLYTDVVDWIGGYPFEVARCADVVTFMENCGFAIERLIDVGCLRNGCNEFVFVRADQPAGEMKMPHPQSSQPAFS